MQLQEYFDDHKKIGVAFSGGVDSSFLLYAAKAAGCKVHAYYAKSQFQPQFELNDAKRLADMLDVPLTVETLDVLGGSTPDVQTPTEIDQSPPYGIVAMNTPERCYYCKKMIMTKLMLLARADGFECLCDGTNADDNFGDRPGMRAISELGIESPLRVCRLTKTEIRRLSKEAGLFTYDKPAYACLATRIPTGTEITQAIVSKIERAENAMFSMKFFDFRVRFIPPGAAKIQLPEAQWDKAALLRSEILAKLQNDFDGVVLDLETR